MKRNRTNIFTIIALGALMACGPMAIAQDASTNSAAAPAPRAAGRGGAALQPLLDKLDLTADQKEKVKPIVADQRDKTMALRSDTSLSRADRQAKIKEITEATDAKLKVILTPEQFTKFEDLRKSMAGGRRARPTPPAGGTTNAPPN